MFKLPYGCLPGHWGLAGKTREIAKAEYELTGYDLEKRLLEIRADELETLEYKKKLIELNRKYGVFTDRDYKVALAKLITNDTQRELALLDIDFKDGKITEIEYAKKSASLRKEPWVTVINMDFNGKSALEGSFELDWNDEFVEKLKAEGYVGNSPDIIVNQWFMEVCRNVAMEEFDGTGDFAADSEANLEAFKRWHTPQSESFKEGRKGYK